MEATGENALELQVEINLETLIDASSGGDPTSRELQSEHPIITEIPSAETVN
ncbi:hypothetical protein Pst134EA_017582 [Puccinia striiformis f. sp. tritici]|uniref:hypothetical protein n=1 Tax=Puccinia striiformis f. sp. tritici TaxID=168172 RepID=UPI0020086398|nr:hypothetical protein Pst134EA_017582 [Puccinia striiformis f. sp. tritici]KAH9461275.1 hypothetical protein Pst134EA_017582 [Puccinia striiformis f. sp. tritici]